MSILHPQHVEGVAWLSIWLLPLLGAITLPFLGRRSMRWMPCLAIPGLVMALACPAEHVVHYPWLLSGMSLGVDAIGSTFLFFTTIVWMLGALFAAGYVQERTTSFSVYLLLAMAGNFGLIVAMDMLSFYLFFALMSFASYGLVVHDRSDPARRAGKVYIILVVVGEVMIFSAMVVLASFANGYTFRSIDAAWVEHPLAPIALTCLLLGFGIKAGALPLHVWLPLAHPAAPIPASAVLSGAMIKAGLLGWIRFLPIGAVALPRTGDMCFVAGLVAALFASLWGLFQHRAKVLLAYSSIAKMGLMTMTVGVALMHPSEAHTLLAAVGLFAMHHAFCKGALFLGVGIPVPKRGKRLMRWATCLGLLVAPLSMAGAAGSSGAVAKAAWKKHLVMYEGVIPHTVLTAVVLATTVGTALLMLRYGWLLFTDTKSSPHRPARMAYGAWLAQVIFVATAPLIFLWRGHGDFVALALDAKALWQANGPLVAVIALGVLLARKPHLPLPQFPAGDLLVFYGRLGSFLRGLIGRTLDAVQRSWPPPWSRRAKDYVAGKAWSGRLMQMEQIFGRVAVFGFMFLGLLAALLVLVHYGVIR